METQIYSLDVRFLLEDTLFDKLSQGVRSERREKIERLRFRKDQLLCLGAGLLLKKVLIDHGIAYWDAGFSTGENGKPFLKEHKDFYYNLSHSGTKVLCAVSDREIGCDVEEEQKLRKNVAEHFFCQKEKEMLFLMEDEEMKKQLFFQIWTLKESFIKATGKGLGISLRSFQVIPSPDGTAKIIQSLYPGDYTLRFYPSQDGYQYAACIKEGKLPEQIREVLPEEIITTGRE